MGVSVIFDFNAFKIRTAEDKNKIVSEVAEQILSDSTPFVPTDGDNILRSSGRVEEVEGKVAVTWDTPYAAYQYYGCWPDGTHKIRNHTTPGTIVQWTERAKRLYAKDWEKVAQSAIKHNDKMWETKMREGWKK